MKYCNDLYFSERLARRREKILDRLKRKKYVPELYLLLIPADGRNQLEIVSTLYFLQPDYPEEDAYVAGIAGNYDDALDMVEEISAEVYRETGDLNIREYLLTKEREG